jgi:hypothetical protein
VPGTKTGLVQVDPSKSEYLMLFVLMARSGGDAVLVQQPTELVGPLDPVQTVELPYVRAGDGHVEVDPAVRALVVVMINELAQYSVEMALIAARPWTPRSPVHKVPGMRAQSGPFMRTEPAMRGRSAPQ